MKDTKGPTTQATLFLKANGVAFTDHLYAYEAHGGASVSARAVGVAEVEVAAIQDCWPFSRLRWIKPLFILADPTF
jgi:hypothetical protein